MENFQALTLHDKELFDNYSKLINTKSYEYAFSSLYLWRNLCNIQYIVINDCLVVQKSEEGKGPFFMMPYGYKKETLQSLVEKLKSISTEDNGQIYLFGDIESSFIDDLKEYTNFKFNIIDDRDVFEYIYKTKDLINLRGKKYHRKKNQYNYFINNYKYDVKAIDSDSIIKDCIELLIAWHKEKIINSKELCIEIPQIETLLYNLNYLNLKSIAIYIDNKLAGFSIGETINDTAVIHVERCNIRYKGIYSFINREFLKLYFTNTLFVNRQEDCGNLGLRQSKESYYPCELLKKSLLVIQ